MLHALAPRVLPSLMLALVIACTPQNEESTEPLSVGDLTDSGVTGGTGDHRLADAATSPSTLVADAAAPCPSTAGISTTPATIAEIVNHINAQPLPVRLPCFLESLPRPLHINATDSTLSVQPATGRRSPRLFLFLGSVIASVVLEGEGRHLIEMGQLVSELDSVKAEVEFPLTRRLEYNDVYSRIVVGEGTSCAHCHGFEVPKPEFAPDAFVSKAVRPLVEQDVPLDLVRHEAEICDAQVEPGRCAILAAIFGHGEVLPAEFPYGIQPLL